MTERQKIAESNKLIKELTKILMKRANLNRKDFEEFVLKGWACEHLDRLTKAELKKYDSIIL